MLTARSFHIEQRCRCNSGMFSIRVEFVSSFMRIRIPDVEPHGRHSGALSLRYGLGSNALRKLI